MFEKSLDEANSVVDDYIEGAKEVKFSYEEFEEKCKSIKYQNKGHLGINFYAYSWYSREEVEANQTTDLITDVGYDNFKDIDLSKQCEVCFNDYGKEFYADNEVEEIHSFLSTMKTELNKVVDNYNNIIKEIKEISASLAEITIPNINLSEDYESIANKLNKLSQRINGVMEDE